MTVEQIEILIEQAEAALRHAEEAERYAKHAMGSDETGAAISAGQNANKAVRELRKLCDGLAEVLEAIENQ